jgi:hypothetical protein
MALSIGISLLLHSESPLECLRLIEREQDIEPKVSIKYTTGIVTIPKIDQNFAMVTWCPRIIREKEDRSFTLQDHSR